MAIKKISKFAANFRAAMIEHKKLEVKNGK